MDGDRVFTWDAATQRYTLAAKTGDGWFEEGDRSQPARIGLRAGSAFWLENRQSVTQSVFLCGEVVLDERSSMCVLPGLNALGFPFSSAIPLDRTALRAVMPPCDALLVEDAFGLGQGCWYLRNLPEPLRWEEPRPYARPAVTVEREPPANMEGRDSPCPVTGMSVSGDGSAVTLVIACAGEPGDRLSIFSKDADASAPPNLEGDWVPAADGLDPLGARDLRWTDRGDDTRKPISSVKGRYYLVARAGVDVNAREKPPHLSPAGDLPANAGGLRSTGTGDASGAAQASPHPCNPRGPRRTIFVDAGIGDDSRSGLARLRTRSDGPKRTINAALRAAQPADDVVICEGVYAEAVSFCGRGVNVSFRGNVTIR